MGAGITATRKASITRSRDLSLKKELTLARMSFVRFGPGHYVVTQNGASVTVQTRWLHASNGEAALLTYVQGRHQWADLINRILYALSEVRQHNQRITEMEEAAIYQEAMDREEEVRDER